MQFEQYTTAPFDGEPSDANATVFGNKYVVTEAELGDTTKPCPFDVSTSLPPAEVNTNDGAVKEPFLPPMKLRSPEEPSARKPAKNVAPL